MPPVKILTDQENLVSTKRFPKKYAHFPFKEFNPVQSALLDIYDKSVNAIIAAATSSGKTACSEMFASYTIRHDKKKAIYLAPLKALAKEKIDDWSDPKHHFSDLKLSICTGDYRLTEKRKKELAEADLIVMTTEMLAARMNNYGSEKNEFLNDVGVCICDEFHLLSVQGRGNHLEVGLMKFSEVAKDCRFVGLSATMPNVQEIAEWVAYSLTGRETYLVNSTYRPCPLGMHWEQYEEKFSYQATEEEKVNAALAIVEDYPDDNFLVFVHTKNTGKMVFNALKRAKIKCEYHNADLEKEDRHKIEAKFKTGQLRVLVATSTLAWGLDLPARRVIITGVHRGLNEVESYDIFQMAGRAGRPKYDPRGDAYVLLPEKKFDYHFDRLSKPQNIESRLLEYVGDETNPHYKTLAFHLVGEIYQGDVKDVEDIRRWYAKSLAAFQANDLHQDIVEATLELLKRYGAIYELDGELKVTAVGRVASMFYYSPFDVADLRRNFNFVFENGFENDLAIAMALGNVDTVRMGFVSKAEREEMGSFAAQVNRAFGGIHPETAIKGGYAYHTLLHGLGSGPFTALARNFQFDFPRTAMVLKALDSMSAKWKKRQFFDDLQIRLSYGVRRELVPFCRLPGIGKVYSERLAAAGFKGYEDIVARPEHVQKVLNLKKEKIDEIIDAAKEMK